MFVRFRALEKLLTLAALAPLALAACDDEAETGTEIPAVTASALTNYAEIVHASYEDSLAVARTMSGAIDAFTDDPTAATLDDARRAWLDAREPYLQTEVYRFYDGPIDDPATGPEGLINAWPLDETYIDTIIAGDEAINAESLEALNEAGGEENVATGYHAIEYLLWGADTAEDGPGDRPATDFDEAEADEAERRKIYLYTTSDLLIAHLEGLVAAWADGGANYRAEFEAAPPEEGLRRVLTGMIVLSGFETGGERLQAALDSGDQEDEHSCFSDNTHRDMIQDVRGIRNVWFGEYQRTDGTTIEGPGIDEVIRAADAALATRVEEKITESYQNAQALEVPFDQSIQPGNTEGRAKVEALILSLRDLEGLLQDAFSLFGLSVPVVE